MVHRDRYGYSLATASEAAATAYGQALDLILSAWVGADAALDRAIAADPEFALAHIARARVHQIYGEAGLAREKAARARELSATVTKRERQHVNAIAAAVEGQATVAVALAEEHLDEFPRDALVLSMLLGAFGLYAFSGRADHDAAKLAICERHARHYGEDWWFLTYLGWSHTEAGQVARGRAITEQALALRRENGHGAHALAHALFEQGEATTGSQFLADWLPSFENASFLAGHLSWHLALVALDSGNVEEALSIYEAAIRPSNFRGPPINALSDAASLLWRIGLTGQAELEPHWREVAAFADRAYPRAGVHFIDVHWALAAAALKTPALDQRLAEMENLLALGKLPPGGCVIDMCRGLRAFANGENRRAIEVLEPLMPEVVRIGGSHAQRELVEDTLIVACLRAGDTGKARALIDRRLHHRPSARDEAWRQRAGQQ